MAWDHGIRARTCRADPSDQGARNAYPRSEKDANQINNSIKLEKKRRNCSKGSVIISSTVWDGKEKTQLPQPSRDRGPIPAESELGEASNASHITAVHSGSPRVATVQRPLSPTSTPSTSTYCECILPIIHILGLFIVFPV